tara:strand:- start:332 stop:475 length:144 start_codon:yes stop_codon:yes gene_type:complete
MRFYIAAALLSASASAFTTVTPRGRNAAVVAPTSAATSMVVAPVVSS